MPRPSEPPIVLVKWYDLTKWLLAHTPSFPKSQRNAIGQRLADRTLGVLETRPGLVILLHGLARSSDSMGALEEALVAKGYRTRNVDDPSSEHSFEGLVDRLAAEGELTFSARGSVNYPQRS